MGPVHSALTVTLLAPSKLDARFLTHLNLPLRKLIGSTAFLFESQRM